MLDHSLEHFLRRRHGMPQKIDLTQYLKAPGKWFVEGWKIFETDEVVLYYSALEEQPVILVVKRLAGNQPRAWKLQSFEQAAGIAQQYLTEKDMSRFRFGISPFTLLVE
jgi:hypothetical protein